MAPQAILKSGGEGGIRTHYHHAESAACRFYVPHNATNATATKAACPTLPDGIDLMPDGAKAEAGSSKLLICFSKVLNQAASSFGIRSSFDNKEHLRPWRHFLNIDDHAESVFCEKARLNAVIAVTSRSLF